MCPRGSAIYTSGSPMAWAFAVRARIGHAGCSATVPGSRRRAGVKPEWAGIRAVIVYIFNHVTRLYIVCINPKFLHKHYQTDFNILLIINNSYYTY